MTEWTMLKRLLDAVHQHSTAIGRLWLTVMVVFRLLVVAVAAEDVYADERDMFVCDTTQPGCPNVCYDTFAPISQPRFWVFHIVAVSAPSLCFVVYAWHSLSERPAGACDTDSCSIRSRRHLGHSLADLLAGTAVQGAQRRPGGHSGGPSHQMSVREDNRQGGGVLSKYYIIHVCFRAFLELAFIAAQWLLFGFQVPSLYVCVTPPCPQPVNCYVSRPTEKTIFLAFMFCVGIFCIVLNFLELNHLGWKKVTGSVRMPESWKGYEGVNQDGCSEDSLTYKDVTSTASLPTLDLVVKQKSGWTFAGACSPLKEDMGTAPHSQAVHKGTQTTKNQSGKDRNPKHKGTEVWI